MALVPYPDALQRVLSRIEALGPTEVVETPIADALGLVVAVDVVAPEPIPPFDNTAVDGFAVRSADVVDVPTTLRVVTTIPAGAASTVSIGAGECARIMTGAVIPEGADAVVMVEDTVRVDPARGRGAPGSTELVEIRSSVGPDEHVRPTGDDLIKGKVALRAGTVISPAHVGLLATVGCAEVEAHRRPSVGVLSTGDELIGPGVQLRSGQIRDSNRAMLLALCGRAGFDGVDLGLISDDEAAIDAALRAAAASCDAVITSGGVSMGDFDYVKAVLARIGDMEWMQVAIKPAKPFAFGTINDTPIFGLPGNPVSSLVSFELFARPGLRAMAGYPNPRSPRIPAIAGENLTRRSDGKTHFMRVNMVVEDGRLSVTRTGGQGSHQLAASAGADALAVVPDGDGVPAGDPVELMLLG